MVKSKFVSVALGALLGLFMSVAQADVLPKVGIDAQPNWAAWNGGKPVNGILWEVKTDSLNMIQADNKYFFTVLYRAHKDGTPLPDEQYSHYLFAVAVDECKNGSGILLMTSEVKDVPMQRIPFSFSDRPINHGTFIAAILCREGLRNLEEQTRKLEDEKKNPKIST